MIITVKPKKRLSITVKPKKVEETMNTPKPSLNIKVTPKKLRPQAVKCYALTLEEYLDDHGYASEEDMLFDLFLESVIPAMCKSACSVEPDGFCPHDCPSPLLDRLL